MEILRTNQLESQKAKRQQVHEQPHRVHGHEHHDGDEKITRSGGLKKKRLCTTFGSRGVGRYLLIINSLTNFMRIKVHRVFFSQKRKKKIREVPKREKPDKLFAVLSTSAILVLLRFSKIALVIIENGAR